MPHFCLNCEQPLQTDDPAVVECVDPDQPGVAFYYHKQCYLLPLRNRLRRLAGNPLELQKLALDAMVPSEEIFELLKKKYQESIEYLYPEGTERPQWLSEPWTGQ